MFCSLRDRVADGQRTTRYVGVQPFHHSPIELDDAFPTVLRQIERRDDFPRLRHFVRGWGKGGIAGCDLAGMDQRLSVEAHVAALRAFPREAVRIAEVVEHAIDDVE